MNTAAQIAASFARPHFNFVAFDEARILAARALRLHRQADDERDSARRASLRKLACRMEREADDLVPSECR